MFKKIKRGFYYCWEPLPNPWKEAVCWALKATFVILVISVLAVSVSFIYPDLLVSLSWGDFKVSSSAAKNSAKEAGEAERKAREALARIEGVEKSVQGQRATIEASFNLAFEANKISSVATQTLAEAQKSLDRMKAEADFIDTVSRAISGYADAYDSLQFYRTDDPRFAKAYNTVEFIRDYHALWNSVMQKPPHYPSRFGTNATGLTLQELSDTFQQMTLIEQLEAVSFINHNSQLPVADKLTFFHFHSLSNANLRVRASAGKYYMQLAGLININNPLQPGIIRQHYLTNSAPKP